MAKINRHDKAEIASGISYLIIYAGALYHVLRQGDWISAAVMSLGTIGAVYYGLLHLRSKYRWREIG